MKGIVGFIVLLNIIVNIGPGSAILCYECHELMGMNLDCENNVKNVLTPNCTSSFYCIKYIVKSNTTSEIYRSCSPKSRCEELTAASAAVPSSVLEFCETCDSPLCNAGFTPDHAVAMLTCFFFATLKLLV